MNEIQLHKAVNALWEREPATKPEGLWSVERDTGWTFDDPSRCDYFDLQHCSNLALVRTRFEDWLAEHNVYLHRVEEPFCHKAKFAVSPPIISYVHASDGLSSYVRGAETWLEALVVTVGVVLDQKAAEAKK